MKKICIPAFAVIGAMTAALLSGCGQKEQAGSASVTETVASQEENGETVAREAALTEEEIAGLYESEGYRLLWHADPEAGQG